MSRGEVKRTLARYLTVQDMIGLLQGKVFFCFQNTSIIRYNIILIGPLSIIMFVCSNLIMSEWIDRLGQVAGKIQLFQVSFRKISKLRKFRRQNINVTFLRFQHFRNNFLSHKIWCLIWSRTLSKKYLNRLTIF